MSTFFRVIGTVASIVAVIPSPIQPIAAAVAVGANIGAAVTAKRPANDQQGRQLQFKIGADMPIPFVMGRTAVGGSVIYRDTYGKDNSYQTFFIVLSASSALTGIGGIESFTADKATVPFAGMEATGYFAKWMWQDRQLGVAPAPAALSNGIRNPPYGFAGTPPGWGPDAKLSGYAATSLSLLYDTKARRYAQGEPTPSWIVKGNLVYDPRRDSTYPGGSGPCRWADPSNVAAFDAARRTWIYSETPALHGLMWRLGVWWRDMADAASRYQKIMGIGAPIDMIDLAAIVQAANVQEANGWRIGGEITSAQDKWEVLKLIEQTGGCEPIAVGAMMSTLVKAPRVSLRRITAADLADGMLSAPGVRRRSERLNGFRARFRSEPHGWEIVPIDIVQVPAYVTEDGRARTGSGDFSLCPDPDQCAELAAYEVFDSRELEPITLPLKPFAVAYRLGDCLTIDIEEIGLQNRDVIVRGRRVDPATGIVTLTLRTETAAKHPAALGLTGETPPTPTLTADPDSIAAPAAGSWTLTAGTAVSNGLTVPAIYVDGTVDNSNADGIVIEYRRVGDGTWSSTGLLPPDTRQRAITPVEAGVSYEAVVRYRGRGIYSDGLLIGPVRTLDASADWETGVVGPGKPENGATVGAPVGTKVGDTPVEKIEKFVVDTGAEIERLVATYGSTETAAASAAAASGFSDAAKLAKEAAERAKGASEAAAATSSQAKENAEKASADAGKASSAAAAALSDAAGQATLAGEAKAAASGYASSAARSAETATGGAATATEQAGIATTAKDDAGKAATASAGSARNASSSADAAGQSATAASADRLKAEQAQGKAEVAQGNAATSESNAAGSASAASSSAAVSATAARDAAGAAMTLARSPGASPSTWSYNNWTSFTPAIALPRLIEEGFASLANGQLRTTSGVHIHPARPTALAPTRRYRVRARARMLTEQVAGDGGHTIYLMTWDADGNPLINILMGGTETTKYTVAQGEFVLESRVFSRAAIAEVYTLPAGTAFGRAMYRTPGGAMTELREVYLVDVEAEEAAAASAAASAKSASTAAASESNASKSASAADTSATNARTSEGNASTSASNASKSESNAAGSASTASAQAVISATSARDAAGVVANENGSPGQAPTQWTVQQHQALFPDRKSTVETFPIVNGRLRLPGAYHVHPFAARAIQAGRRYRVVGTIRAVANDGNQQNEGSNTFYLAAWRADGTYLQYTLGDLGAIGGDRGDVPFSSQTFGLPGSGAQIVLDASAAWARQFYRSPGGTNVFELVSLRLIDVEAETAAAGSATAAAGSAGTAKTSETEAGKSASAAQTSETNAKTSEGNASRSEANASTSASNASKSETNAAGSSSSAASSSSVSATAARDAAGVAANEGGAPGQAPTQWSVNQYLTFQPDRASNVAGYEIVNGRVRFASALHVHPLNNRAMLAKRRYRVVGRIRCVRNDGQQQNVGGNTFYLTAWDSAGNSFIYYMGDLGPLGADGKDYEFTSVTIGLPGSGASLEINGSIAWGRPMYRSPGGANTMELVSLRLIDVEGETAAAGSAAAAALSASNASSSESAAGQSATASSTSATNASTSAGNAKTSETNASKSEANAAGSSTSAASSAIVAATAAAAAAGAALTPFSPGASPVTWSLDRWQAFSPDLTLADYVGAGQMFRVVNGRLQNVASTGNHVHPKKSVQIVPGRRYRGFVRVRMIADGSQPAGNVVFLNGWDASGAVTQETIALFNLGDLTVAQGEVYASVIVGTAGTPGINAAIDARTRWARVMYRTAVAGGAIQELGEFGLIDIEAETAAAGSATAAAGSASTAKTSETEAGKSATAASTAKTAAEAAQGKAEGAAGTATSQASSATASAAAAQASSIVSAQVSATLSNLGATFTDWPDARGIPAPWQPWGNGANNRVAGISGRYGFQQGVNNGAAETGLLVTNSMDAGLLGLGQGAYIVVADVTLDAGLLHGAGILFRGFDNAGNVLVDHMNSFSQMPSQATAGAPTGNGTVGRRYQFSRLVEMPAGVTQLAIYLMSAWTAFANPVPAKTITWHKCGVRPATQAEIAAGKVSDLQAKVEENSGAIAVASARVASAWSEKTTTVPGAAAAIRMMAMLENGQATSNIALIATQIALLNMVDGRVIPALKAEGGNIVIANDLRGGAGRIIFDNGSVMKVSGTGFGSNNQFIEWFGPRKANLAECTEANATSYLKTDGSSYFGGSLRAGIIKNAVQTTSLALDANVSTGEVGSNGGQRVVVVTYAWGLTQSVDRPQSAGTGGGLSASVILSRNGVDVATLNATGGVWSRTPASGADEPGSYTEQIGGSITFTDNSGGASVTYAVRLASRTQGPGPENGSSRAPVRSQGIGIIQTEG